MDVDVYIFGDRAAFRVSSYARWFWAPDTAGGPITDYTGAVPNTARLVPATASSAKHLVFTFRRTKLDVSFMPIWARTNTRPTGESDFGSAKIGKSNVLGAEMSGPFSWMARLLKGAGAKREYGVHSPKVLFKWTARDLAKYCDRISLASQKNPVSDSDTEFNYYDDGEDD